MSMTVCSERTIFAREWVHNQAKETTMNQWLKPRISETEAGMEVTSYLPAEMDFA
jgi:coenzyme PQQ precursor peptide PqqA